MQKMIAAAAFTILFAPAPAGATSIGLTVVAPALDARPGESVLMNIDVGEANDLYAFQLAFQFDPTVLEAIEITEGAFLGTGGPTFYLPGLIEDGAGTITYAADTLVGVPVGVFGNGTLATIRFRARSPGVTFVTLTNLQSDTFLLTSELTSPEFEATGALVTVQAVPEPGTIVLVGICGLYLIVRRVLVRARISVCAGTIVGFAPAIGVGAKSPGPGLKNDGVIDRRYLTGVTRSLAQEPLQRSGWSFVGLNADGVVDSADLGQIWEGFDPRALSAAPASAGVRVDQDHQIVVKDQIAVTMKLTVHDPDGRTSPIATSGPVLSEVPETPNPATWLLLLGGLLAPMRSPRQRLTFGARKPRFSACRVVWTLRGSHARTPSLLRGIRLGAALLAILSMFATISAAATGPNPDLNHDGVVNLLDLTIVARCFGQPLTSTASCAIADVDGNGVVDNADLAEIRAAYGRSGFPVLPSADRIAHLSTGAQYVAGELLVILNSGTANPQQRMLQIASFSGGTLMGGNPEVLTYQVKYSAPDLQSLQSTRSLVAGLADVAAVHLHYASDSPYLIAPNDPWYVLRQGSLLPIFAPLAWELSTGSRSIGVAIIDGDLDMFHSDLATNIQRRVGPSRNVAINGHGTHVAGIACGVGDNRVGIAGVAWQCGLSLYEPPTLVATLQSALFVQSMMIQAVNDGARVVNMSLGFIGSNEPCLAPETQERVRAFNDLFGAVIGWAQRTRRDVLWVFAAGNEHRDASCQSPASLSVEYPANVITVAATVSDFSHRLASFSNFGGVVSIAAPGVNIFSTVPENSYDFKSGTSMAAPVLTGVAVLVRAAHPEFVASQVKACIVDNAFISTDYFGIRVVDAWGATSCGAATRELTVSKVGLGSGTVVSVPAGLACGPSCQSTNARYGRGTPVQLHAVPAAGSAFIGWGGDCSGNGTSTIDLDIDRTCTARFDAGQLTLNKTGLGSGSVISTPAGISCGTACVAEFSWGTKVQLHPVPDPRSVFAGWTGDCDSDGVVTAAGSIECTATFNKLDTPAALLDRRDYSIEPAYGFRSDVAVADFDGDGRPDVAVTHGGNGVVAILLNNGDGTFKSRADISVGAFVVPNSVRAIDLNGDGRIDLAVADGNNGGRIITLFGNGDGTFGSPWTTPGGLARSIVFADFNRDGQLDYASVWSPLALAINRGRGGFFGIGYLVGTGYQPQFVTAGDLDGDGRIDLAVSAANCDTACGPGLLSILLQQTGGNGLEFGADKKYAAPVGPGYVRLGDLNGDGHLDVVVTATGTVGVPGTAVAVYLGRGDGTLAPYTLWQVGTRPVSASAGDFDGDGRLDLAVINQDSATVSVLIGNGDGTFTGRQDFATAGSPTALATADMDGDGRLDMVISNGGIVSVLLNRIGG